MRYNLQPCILYSFGWTRAIIESIQLKQTHKQHPGLETTRLEALTSGPWASASRKHVKQPCFRVIDI